MQYRNLPGTNEKLSVLGYGCMRLPTIVGGEASSLIDKDKALRQIRYAIDQGVNYLDTAYPYHLGASESFLGEYVLKDGYREKVNIATKLPCMTITKKESIEKIFNKQLEKLQVDYIDYYLMHALSGQSWERMLSLGIIEFMDKIKKEGKVRFLGFSFHGTREDFKKIVDSYDWDFTQIQFNILDEHFQAGLEGMKYAASKGLGVFIMEPLRGGYLVGQIPKEVQQIYDLSPVKRSSVDWALRWIWNHPEVTLVLSGMNKQEHIEDNIRIASESLPKEMSEQEVSIVEQVRDKYKELMKIGCTGCAYCMPCPAGIDIPSAFKQYNNYYMFSKMGAKIQHAAMAGIQIKDNKPKWTTSCIGCAKCEKACPQNIEVRKEFEHVHKDLEGATTRGVAAIGRKILGTKNTNKDKLK